MSIIFSINLIWPGQLLCNVNICIERKSLSLKIVTSSNTANCFGEKMIMQSNFGHHYARENILLKISNMS